MKRNLNQFFKGSFNYRTEADGPLKHAPRFSYESEGRLYDVIQLPAGTVYKVNGLSHLTPNSIHQDILTYFGERHVEWTHRYGVTFCVPSV